MTSKATTPDEYIAQLPEDRKETITKLRKVINDNLPDGYEEGMQYGMLGWYVPHSIYPDGYHCDPKQPVPFVSLASQKAHIGFYAFCLYVDDEIIEWFKEEHAKTGFKLDMGKSCVRYKKLDQIPYDLIGRTIAKIPLDDFLAHYTASIPESKKKKK